MQKLTPDDRAREAIDLLSHAHSAKRQAAAKVLRRLRTVAACPALRLALEAELATPRTWETQYHLVMALGESGCQDAIPLLQSIAGRQVEHMVLLAAGDAIVRLTPESGRSDAILSLMESFVPALAEGGLRAVAMLRWTPPESTLRAVLAYASQPENSSARFWAAAAAPGWDGPEVREFLTACLADSSADTRRAATHALEKVYVNWKPL